MKIVYIANSKIPSRTANSIHVMKMCCALAKWNNKVILVCPKVDQFAKSIQPFEYYGVEKNFRIIRIPFSNFGSYVQKGVLAALTGIYFNADFVYSRDLYAAFVSILLRRNVIIELHSTFSSKKSILKRLFMWMISKKNLCKIIFISKKQKEIYLKQFIIKLDKIGVIPDAADEQNHSEKVSNWPGRTEALQIGYFGHLYAGRGIDILIKCAEKLPGYDFHIVGGNNDDIKYWKRHSNYLSNIFFHGFVSPAIVHRYRNMCDILCAPYQKKLEIAGSKENTSEFMSPLKIFEYKASKKAIVVSNLPVIHEALNHNSAIFVEPDNINSWVSAIISLEEQHNRTKIAINAYNNYLHNNTWNHRAELILKILKKKIK